MKKMVVGILVFAVALSVSAGEWKTYRNEKYQYEIQHPDSWEVVEGGVKGERDGRHIFFSIKEFTLDLGVSVRVFPGLSIDKLLSKHNMPSLKTLDKEPVSETTTLHKITWEKIIAHDVLSVQMEIRGVDNDILIEKITFRDYVVLSESYTRATSNETRHKIIQSFKWSNRRHNKANSADAKSRAAD